MKTKIKVKIEIENKEFEIEEEIEKSDVDEMMDYLLTFKLEYSRSKLILSKVNKPYTKEELERAEKAHQEWLDNDPIVIIRKECANIRDEIIKFYRIEWFVEKLNNALLKLLKRFKK